MRNPNPQTADAPGSRILVVVAHPDDEVLWFCPLLRSAATILVALPVHSHKDEITRGRELVSAEYPLNNLEYLRLRSPRAYFRSDWLRRRPVEEGVTLLPSCPEEIVGAYHETYRLLVDELESYIRAHDVVYSHNLWGEYGHEEHIQVAHAVVSLASRFGKSVWAWDGLPSERLVGDGMRLRHDFYRNRTSRLPRAQMKIDIELYRKINKLYRSHGVWTWDDRWEPSGTLDYIQLVRDGEVLLTPRPLAKFRIDARVFAGRVGRRVRRSIGRWVSSLRSRAPRAS